MAESRSRRQTTSRADKARMRMESIKQSEASGMRRTQTLELSGATMFEEVDEEEYAKIVKSRANDFVVDDDGLGYADHGEEDWQREAESDEEAELEEELALGSKGGKGEAKRNLHANKAETASAGTRKLQDMFKTQGLRPAGLSSKSDIPSSGLGGLGKRKITPPNTSEGGGSALASKIAGGRAASSAASSGGMDFMSDILSEVKAKGPEKKARVGAAASSNPFAKRAPVSTAPRSSVLGARSKPAAPSAATMPVAAAEDDCDMGGADFADDAPVAQAEEVSEATAAGGDAMDTSVDSAAGAAVAKPSSDDVPDGMDVDEAAAQAANAARLQGEMNTDLHALWEEDGEGQGDASPSNEEGDGDPSVAGPSTEVSTTGLPINDDGSLDMFWYDATEEPSHPGRIYLFGKVKIPASEGTAEKFVSCCCIVDNMPRTVFLLPRKFHMEGGKLTDKPVDPEVDVYSEFKELARFKGVKKFQAKPVERKFMYSFEQPDVPAEGKYLKVIYPSNYPALPSDLSGRTFSHTFGTTSSALETFILKRDLMGPSWLKVKNVRAVSTGLSWCKVECVVDDPKLVLKMDDAPESPPLTSLSIHLQTVINPKQHSNEVVMVSALVHRNVACDGPTANPKAVQKFTAVRKLDTASLPHDFQQKLASGEGKRLNAVVVPNERALLNWLVSKLQGLDPDVIVGHNFMGFDLDVLLHRMSHHKIPQWSKLGRLRRSVMPKLKAGGGGSGSVSFSERQAVCGRIVCDTYLAARELLQKETTYTLTELCRTQLNHIREEAPEDPATAFTTSDKLMKLISINANDAFLAQSLMFRIMVLPLSKQLTNLAGNLWARSLLGARAERIEYLLLHEFYKQKFVLPDKMTWAQNNAKKNGAGAGGNPEDDEDPFSAAQHSGGQGLGGSGGKSGKGKRKPAYAGGLVLEPKRGLYDKHVLLLDFNSLYPSIIQEHNICFTTVKFPGYEEEPGPDGERAIKPYELPTYTSEKEMGILPLTIRQLVQRRRQVKNMLKELAADSLRYKQLDIRQLALKILANSMYGCLGFTHSRFYAKPLAEMVTSQGRETLQRTVDHAQNKLNLEVVYGDTDSIMINSGEDDLEKALAIATEAKKSLNKMFRLLELDVDGVYCPMLLLQKKKYAAMSVSKSKGEIVRVMEKKGLDLVRRDWCPLSKKLGMDILEDILDGGKSREEIVECIHSKLRKFAMDLEAGLKPMRAFAITKGLTKAPEDYPDAKGQPHVQVALQMRKENKTVAAGMHIPYIICEGEAGAPAAQRAHHPDAIQKANGALKIDVKWYLGQQIHPPISRLCAVIEGTDSARLAECLGLDPSKYHDSVQQAQSRGDGFTFSAEDEDRFRDCEHVCVVCPKCHEKQTFDGVYRQVASGKWVCGLQCDSDACRGNEPGFITPQALRAGANMVLRSAQQKFYDGWMRCSDGTCGQRTRGMSCRVYCPDQNPNGKKEAGRACLRAGCSGRLDTEFGAPQLYRQLLYLSRMFSLGEAKDRLQKQNANRDQRKLPRLPAPTMSPEQESVFEMLEGDMRKAMADCAYGTVNLTSLFSAAQ